jgi:glycosyltransferase involved in cell wall biosynthesis
VPTPTLTVIVPFYNEERTLEELVQKLKNTRAIFEKCLFIDDGSTDNSFLILSQALKEVEFSSEIVRQSNKGKGAAVRNGITRVDTTHVAILDADLELDPYALGELWEPIFMEREIATLGFRSFLSQSSYTYRYSVGNRVISNIYGFVFNRVVTDVMCGYKVFPSRIFNKFPFESKRFSIEIDILSALWREEIRPFEILVSYKARGRSEGKVIGFSDAISVLLRILFLRLLLKSRTN